MVFALCSYIYYIYVYRVINIIVTITCEQLKNSFSRNPTVVEAPRSGNVVEKNVENRK